MTYSVTKIKILYCSLFSRGILSAVFFMQSFALIFSQVRAQKAAADRTHARENHCPPRMSNAVAGGYDAMVKASNISFWGRVGERLS